MTPCPSLPHVIFLQTHPLPSPCSIDPADALRQAVYCVRHQQRFIQVKHEHQPAEVHHASS